MPYWQVRLLRPGGGVMVFGIYAGTRMEAVRQVEENHPGFTAVTFTPVPSVKERLTRNKEKLATEREPAARILWEQKKLER